MQGSHIQRFELNSSSSLSIRNNSQSLIQHFNKLTGTDLEERFCDCVTTKQKRKLHNCRNQQLKWGIDVKHLLVADSSGIYPEVIRTFVLCLCKLHCCFVLFCFFDKATCHKKAITPHHHHPPTHKKGTDTSSRPFINLDILFMFMFMYF